MPNVKPARDLIGLDAAAAICGVTPRTIRRWIAAGQLPAVRVGPRLIKVSTRDLSALMTPVGGGAA